MVETLTIKDCLICPFKSDIFKLLTKAEMKLINKNRIEAHYNSREVIFKQGSPISHVVFISKGMVKLYIEGYDNKNLILGITKPTQYITGPGLYYENRNHYSAKALTDTQACFIDARIFKEIINENRKFSEGFITEFSRRSVLTLGSLLNLTQKKMPGRMAEGLLYLANTVFENNNIDLILSKQELGDLTGMTRESAIRILNEFKKDGLIDLMDNSISILDEAGLKTISNKG